MNKKALLMFFVTFIIGVIIAIGLFVAPVLLFPDNDESLNLAIARTLLSVITIPIVVVGFFYTTIQFRKASAKPKLEVMFSEEGKKTWEFECSKYHWEGIPLWINNSGNAVAELFSIDFILPVIFTPRINQPITDTINEKISGKIKTISFLNNRIKKYICFVNKPIQIEPLLLLIEPSKYNEYDNPLIIKYKIFGNWDSIQEGELKVIINKQEVPNVPTSS